MPSGSAASLAFRRRFICFFRLIVLGVRLVRRAQRADLYIPSAHLIVKGKQKYNCFVYKGELTFKSFLRISKSITAFKYITKIRDYPFYHADNPFFAYKKPDLFKLFTSSNRSGLVRVFITDLILRHSAKVVETYSQSTENACVYKEFCNTKGI